MSTGALAWLSGMGSRMALTIKAASVTEKVINVVVVLPVFLLMEFKDNRLENRTKMLDNADFDASFRKDGSGIIMYYYVSSAHIYHHSLGSLVNWWEAKTRRRYLQNAKCIIGN
jgi:hypothetical protein